jgi:D-alanine-D-alanine ligase
LGAMVSAVDAGRDIAEVLSRLRPDVALNALHGVWGEDGCVQGVLETLQIPYTHSGVLASALTMDKQRAKDVLSAAGVKVPGGGLFDRFEVAERHVLEPPYVVKPNAEGSSVGVYIVREGANEPVREVGADTWTFGQRVLVEPYVAGKELCVTVLGEKTGARALTVTVAPHRAGRHFPCDLRDLPASVGARARCSWLPGRYEVRLPL